MRSIVYLVLGLTAASAAPSPNLNGSSAPALRVRQNCIYECACLSPNDNPPSDTGSCCSSVGGSLSGDRCVSLPQGQARSFGGCCRNGSICFAPSGCPLPP